MSTRIVKYVIRIASKVKRLLLGLFISPYKIEIIEMILTIIDFLDAILSEFG